MSEMENNYEEMTEIEGKYLDKLIDKINALSMKAFIGSTRLNFPLEGAFFSMMDSYYFKTPLEAFIVGSVLAYAAVKNSCS